MNEDLINLVRLQLVDNKIAKIETIEKETPEQLAEVDAVLKSFEQKVNESVELESEKKKRRREVEAEVDDTENKIKNNQTRQLQAKNNEEYRAMLKEADFLKKANSSLEDELLELMEELEQLAEENEKLKTGLEEERSRTEEKKKNISGRMTVSLEKKSELVQERNGLLKSIPKKNIDLYNRVYNGRNGRAVVAIIQGICQECHLQIPPQNYIELQKNETVMICPNCQRIIYWQEHDDFKDISV